MERKKDFILKQVSASLERTLLATDEGKFFVAGTNQFRTLWVRDFCYSVPGLLKMGFVDVVERQLELINRHRRKDGLLPRGLDVTNPKLRVLWSVLLPSKSFPFDYPSRRMQAEYLGEHNTPAFDSNLLYLKAQIDLARFKRTEFQIANAELEHLLSFYRFSEEDGLIPQPAFSDWQDSVKRCGPLLLTQVLCLFVSRIFQFKNIDCEKFEKSIFSHFYNSQSGLFYETKDQSQVSLDSQWFILRNTEIFPELDRKAMYFKLKTHPLWSRYLIPGVPVSPHHAVRDVSWTTRFVGLRHYHDGLHWGWLIAAAYQISVMFDDEKEAARILDIFCEVQKKLPYLAEIYESTPDGLRPVRTWLYKSECPFTWSSAFWADALV
jgi:hypothetical protein